MIRVRPHLRQGAQIACSSMPRRCASCVKRLAPALFLLALVPLIFAGCSSYSAAVTPGTDIARYHVFFVKENLDDNRGIAARIAASLRDHGFQATSGPMTMLPPAADGVVDFQDQWSWDITTHIVYLAIHVSDAHNRAPVAMGSFSGSTSTASLDDAIDQTVEKMTRTISATKAALEKAMAKIKADQQAKADASKSAAPAK